ncbi:MAG: hypothetical protein C5B57_08265 [Blastocatellia bacterium]|nr:MAG: hypothetical protein C5B57_08265 [Blastocatellia bacterium]
MVTRLLMACLYGLMALIGLDRDFRLRDESSIARTLQFAGPGVHTLDVRTMNGSIRVSGYEGSDVRLEAKQTIAADTAEDLREAREKVIVDTKDQGETIDVVVREPRGAVCGEPWNERSPAWWDRSRYEATVELAIRVPRDTRLRLCTVNGGEVYVDGTAGDFDIDNVNGRITLEQVRGSGRASSVNGRVTASFAEAPRTASLFKTINGHIVATFPAGLSADLRMKTFNGGLFTDFEVEPLVQKIPAAERRGGRLTYRSNGFTSVRVGHGGPELTFEAFNGDVRILRAGN